MSNKYKIRALKFNEEQWKPQFTRPEGAVINGVVYLAEAEYPSHDSVFKTEKEANEATYEYLIKEKINPEDIEIVPNRI